MDKLGLYWPHSLGEVGTLVDAAEGTVILPLGGLHGILSPCNGCPDCRGGTVSPLPQPSVK